MSDHDDLTRRLRELGDAPIPDAVRQDHLHRLAAVDVGAPAPRKRFGRVAVAAAAIVGFAFGSTGLAMAGALPAPAQGAAHDVLSVLQVDVPEKPGRGNGPPAWVLEDPCKGPPAWAGTGVEPTEKQITDHEALRAGCPEDGPGRPEGERGRPDGMGRPDGVPGKGKPDGVPGQGKPDGVPGNVKHADDPCKGPPPWAGKGTGPATEDEATDFELNRAFNCPADVDEAAEPEPEG